REREREREREGRKKLTKSPRRSHRTPGRHQARHHHQPQLEAIIVFLSSRRSRRHQPRRDRSLDEAVRAPRRFASARA
ncbi:unnamed protein product, partial [Brassica oleracea var. botrytis]